MNNQQAIQIIKQLIDAAIKAGVCPNLETGAAVAQAWDIIVKSIPGGEEKKL